ncbi:MAG: hypothetical protein QW692_04195 [Nitrososphaerota archaeon]
MGRPKFSRDPRIAQRIIGIIAKHPRISTRKMAKIYAERYGSVSYRWLSEYLDLLAGLGVIEYIAERGEKPWQIRGGWALTREAELAMRIYKDKRYWVFLSFWLAKRDPVFKFGGLEGRRFNEFIGFPHVEPKLVWRVVEDLITGYICLQCLALYNELWPIREAPSSREEAKKSYKCSNPEHIDLESLPRQRRRSLERKMEKELEKIRDLINRLRLKAIIEKSEQAAEISGRSL